MIHGQIRRALKFLILFIAILILISLSSLPYYSYVTHSRMGKALQHSATWDVERGVGKDFLPILMPVCKRPEYLKLVLEGVVKVQDIDQTVLVVSQDCGKEDITQLVQEYSSKLKIVHMDHIPPYYAVPDVFYSAEYRTSANIKSLLTFAFEYMKADGAIILESDLVPSRDFYRYNKWMYEHFLDQPLPDTFPNPNSTAILSINSFNIDSRAASSPSTFRKAGFSSWGWMTSADRWRRVLKSGWTWMGGWDLVIDRKLYPQYNLMSLTPDLSRVRMIGVHGINVKEDTPERSKPFLVDMYMREGEEDYSYDGVEPVIL